MLRELAEVVPDDLLPPDILTGVTDLAPFQDAANAIRDRNASGMSAGLGFVFRDPELASDPHTSFPWAKSIVVLGVPYLQPGDGYASESADVHGERSIARFADGDRYERVRTCLSAVSSHLGSQGFRSEQVFDDDRLVDRAVAVRSGVGWHGKSTMVITPTAGPWILIGSVVTDAEIAPTPIMERHCGSCTACIPACPTDAIVAPGVLDARRCLAAILQQPGSIPLNLRAAVGARVYGCDECLVACPPGDKVIGVLSETPPRSDARSVLRMSDAELESLATHWYVPRRSYRFVRRNALVALGNTAAPHDIGLLCGYLGHPDALLRGHAAWALGAVSHGAASSGLRLRLGTETDATVRQEIIAALQ